MKATAKVNAKTDAPAKVVITVPAEVRTELAQAATADKSASVAATKRDETIIHLGKTVRRLLGKNDRNDVRDALKPLFAQAYKAQGRDELYAGQQLSRTLSVAYGDQQAIDTVLALKNKGEKVNVAGSDRKINVNDVYKTASGGLVLSKATSKGNGAPKLLATRKDKRGGSNAKKPIESFAFQVGNAVTAAKTAKLKLDALTVSVVESFTANEFDLEDVRTSFEAALAE